MAGDGETMSKEYGKQAFETALQEIEPKDDLERELFAIAGCMFDKYGQDGIDYMCRIANLVLDSKLTREDLEAFVDKDGIRHDEESIRRLAHEHREEKRLDLMIDHCKATGESLDDIEKETRGMRPKQVIEHLALKSGQAEYEATNQ